jgi:hypothetical protein
MPMTVQEILSLVNEIDSEDPIDWGMLNINEDDAVELVVNNLVDQYNTQWMGLDQQTKDRIMLATMAKLVVENFTLNVKLLQ